MDNERKIKVVNRYSGSVGYKIPDTGVRRQFQPREEKEIPFDELKSLSYIPGGMPLLKDYLVIKDEEALKELLPHVEPEYFYDKKEVEKILTEGTVDQFLDCLDFAPEGVIEMVKDLAVSLPLNSVIKRDLIKEKLNFDVTRAIEIKNSKYDGDENTSVESDNEVHGRRTAAINTTEPASTPTRRAKYIKK